MGQSNVKESTMDLSMKRPIVTQSTKQPLATQPTKEETLLHNLSQLQNSPQIVVLEAARAAGFGNWVRGLVTMYTVALCRGMGFRGRLHRIRAN